MAKSVVDEGLELLAAQQAAADQAAAEAREQQLLALGTANIVALLNTVIARMNVLEAQVQALSTNVLASRIRRPVRDANGQIQYVVDELQGPMPGTPGGM